MFFISLWSLYSYIFEFVRWSLDNHSVCVFKFVCLVQYEKSKLPNHILPTITSKSVGKMWSTVTWILIKFGIIYCMLLAQISLWWPANILDSWKNCVTILLCHCHWYYLAMFFTLVIKLVLPCQLIENKKLLNQLIKFVSIVFMIHNLHLIRIHV